MDLVISEINYQNILNLTNISHYVWNVYKKHYKEHYLERGSRLQYGQFLKGNGLSVNEVMKYWRNAFLNMTYDQFNNIFFYKIRYNYGLEGKKNVTTNSWNVYVF